MMGLRTALNILDSFSYGQVYVFSFMFLPCMLLMIGRPSYVFRTSMGMKLIKKKKKKITGMKLPLLE